MALDRERIVTEAVALLDANGLDGLSLRKLADRLGVQAPTLYWHFPNKAALITEVAEAILREEFAELAGPADGEPWPDWLAEIARRLRRAMLTHRDGARIVSAAQASTVMADVSELIITSLTGREVPARRARLLALTVQHIALGYVLAEQTGQPVRGITETFDQAAFAERHPAMIAAITEYFADGSTADDLFDDCVGLLLAP